MWTILELLIARCRRAFKLAYKTPLLRGVLASHEVQSIPHERKFHKKLFLLLMLFGSPAFAQFTQVTGTVKDPNGIAYAGATISGSLVPGSGASPTLNGVGFSSVTSPVGLDKNGKFNMQLADNNVILPSGSQWRFTVNMAPGILPPAGTGPQTFTATITITGASQDISATLNALAPGLSAGGSGLPAGCTSPGAGSLTCTGTVTGNIGSWNSEGTNFTDYACGAQSVGNSNQVRLSCDGTNWLTFSPNSANFLRVITNSYLQPANGVDTIFFSRFTDSSPSGNFLHFQNAAKTTDLFAMTIAGQSLASSGGSAAPAYSFLSQPNSGLFLSSGNPVIAGAGTDVTLWSPTSGIVNYPVPLGWASGDPVSNGIDTAFSRDAAAIIDVGNGAQGNSSGLLRSGNTVFVTANFTTASTSLVTITGLTWTFPATNHNYKFHCDLSYSQATSAAADAFGIQAATTAPTNLYAAMNVGTGLAVSGVDATLPTLTTTTATNIGTFTPSAVGAIGTVADIFTAQIWGTLEQGAGATTLNIMVLTGNASDSITIYRGSFCSLLP